MAGRRAELGLKSRASGQSPKLRFSSPYKFLAFKGLISPSTLGSRGAVSGFRFIPTRHPERSSDLPRG